jgi:hypothetical protein
MIQKNFGLVSLLSLVLFSSTVRAMEEERVVAISMKNATRKDDYIFDQKVETATSIESSQYYNFRFRVDFKEAEHESKGFREGGYGKIPSCFVSAKKLEVPSKNGNESYEDRKVSKEKSTQRIAFYCTSDKFSLHEKKIEGSPKTPSRASCLFDPVELDLGSPINLSAIDISFHGIEERTILNKQKRFPRLSVRINDETTNLQPQKLVDIQTGEGLPLIMPLSVSLLNNTGTPDYGMEAALDFKHRYDFNVEVVLDEVENKLTRAKNEVPYSSYGRSLLVLQPEAGGIDRKEQEGAPTRFISAIVSSKVVSPNWDQIQNNKRYLFGTYLFDLGEETNVYDLQVKFGQDVPVGRAEGNYVLFAPHLLLQINKDGLDREYQKFIWKERYSEIK